VKKLKQDPITKKDINDYLAKRSDFAFEIKTLKLLTRLKCRCRHAGTYTDPITNKIREYDIRARKTRRISELLTFNLMLAIECKNLKDSYPLVVHCMPRARHEAIEEMIFCSRNEVEELISTTNASVYDATTIPLDRSLSSYTIGSPVGKSCDQIGRSQNDDITGSDSDVFEKISQALNSANDLIKEAASFGDYTKYSVSIIRPILVVPDKSLWRIVYDDDGNIKMGPQQVKYIPYYYGKIFTYYDRFRDCHEYNLSHLDIVTYSSLQDHVRLVMEFDSGDLLEHLRRQQNDGVIAKEINLSAI